MLGMGAGADGCVGSYDELWKAHPDLVTMLCSICPVLLDDLFDGASLCFALEPASFHPEG
jgi:hypothetical protein